ncbi:UNVERIFIED_CONTAM: HPt (histidine-containing phosphotransfer) domain-containing protein [Acetivibrio alkalicellulosi]
MSQSKQVIDFDSFVKDVDVDNETMRDLYETFLEEILQERENLKSCLLQNDYTCAGKIIHNIKGISGSYKANELYEIAKNLDLKFKNKITDRSNIQINELLECIQVVCKEIKDYFVDI